MKCFYTLASGLAVAVMHPKCGFKSSKTFRSEQDGGGGYIAWKYIVLHVMSSRFFFPAAVT